MTLAEAARNYAAAGWPIIPLREKGKIPILSNWPKRYDPPSADEISAWWGRNPNFNIGLLCNHEYIAVDLDTHNGLNGLERLQQWERETGSHLPETVTTRTGSGGLHLIYRRAAGDDFEYQLSQDAFGDESGIDFRAGTKGKGGGGQVVLPPSIHPDTGEEYTWEKSPVLYPFAEADDAVRQLFKDAAKAKKSSKSTGEKPGSYTAEAVTIPEGQRNTTLHKLASSLVARGLCAEGILAAVKAENEQRCAPPLEESEVETIVKSAMRYEPGTAPYAPELVPWEAPIPFEKFDAPEFPVDALPGPVRDYVSALAESTQTPVEMAGISALGVLAAMLQGKFEVEVTPDWHETLSLYTVAVAAPAERKSAVLKALTSPLRRYEAQRRELEAPEIAQNATQRDMLEKRLSAAKTAAVKGTDAKAKQAENEALSLSAELSKFRDRKPYRLLVDDTTPERLTDLLADAGALTVVSSEGGVFDAMRGRYENALNLDAYLKGHCGDSIVVDRMGRDGCRIESPHLSMILTVQPQVIAGIMSNKDFRGRGLCGRILFAVCISKIGKRKSTVDHVPEAVSTAYADFCERLLSMQYAGTITLSEDAQGVRTAYQDAVETCLGADWSGFSDWGGKLVGATLRIAALFHASEATTDPTQIPISAETVQRAVKIGEVLAAHAEAAYSQMGADERFTDAKMVLKYLEGCDSISKRDLFARFKSHFHSVEALNPVLKILEERGFIRTETTKTGGRPSVRIFVNPCAQK